MSRGGGGPRRTLGSDDPRWPVGKALFAASLPDSKLTRGYVSVATSIASPDEVLASPGTLDRVLALGAGAPQYPPPGPSGTELLDALACDRMDYVVFLS
jgi:hypothetical protein